MCYPGWVRREYVTRVGYVKILVALRRLAGDMISQDTRVSLEIIDNLYQIDKRCRRRFHLVNKRKSIESWLTEISTC